MSAFREPSGARRSRPRPAANGPSRRATAGAVPVLPAELTARLATDGGPGAPPETPEAVRAALVQLGLSDGAQPAVTVELYGGLRLRTGCRALPLHAGTVAQALDVLCAVYPKAARLLAADGAGEGHYRYSLNGRDVTADAGHPLQAGDHLIVFSASVGG